MASRDLTDRFVSLRARAHLGKPGVAASSAPAEPTWLYVAEEIKRDIESSRALLAKSDHKSEEEHHRLTETFAKCERNLRRIGTAPLVSDQDRQVRLAVMRSLGAQITPLVREQRDGEKQVELLVETKSAMTKLEQIRQLSHDIHRIAQLFQSMHLLVVEQGTVLDRIDYNIDQALVKTRQGSAQLVKAYQRQGTALTKCVLFLVCVLAILVLALVIKLTN